MLSGVLRSGGTQVMKGTSGFGLRGGRRGRVERHWGGRTLGSK